MPAGADGLLAGALLVNAFQVNRGSIDLGFTGSSVLDRSGRAVLDGFARPPNTLLQRQLRDGQVGVLSGVRGLDGAGDHVVAYATAQVPGWTIAIDRPRSDDLRRCATWPHARARADRRRRRHRLQPDRLAAAARPSRGRAQSARARQRGELAHVLGAASLAVEVSTGLAVVAGGRVPRALAPSSRSRPTTASACELVAAEGAAFANALPIELVTVGAAHERYDRAPSSRSRARQLLRRRSSPSWLTPRGRACGRLLRAPAPGRRADGRRPVPALRPRAGARRAGARAGRAGTRRRRRRRSTARAPTSTSTPWP